MKKNLKKLSLKIREIDNIRAAGKTSYYSSYGGPLKSRSKVGALSNPW
jgi:hypothetical protein